MPSPAARPESRGQLAGRTAVVTGAGRGIGLGCARELAAAGALVLLNDRPDSPYLEQAAETIRRDGGRCETVPADAFAPDECARMLAAAERIDILVSNPAFAFRAEFPEYPLEKFEYTLRTTLTSGFVLGQLAAQRMIAQGGGGKMIFISSVHGERPLPLAVGYNAAKAGLEHMVRSMAVELLPHRINVNSIAPGWIDTPGERERFTDAVVDAGGALMPWGRLGTSAEIGKAAVFLASDDADYITGVVLPVDGGFRFRDCLPHTLPLKSS